MSWVAYLIFLFSGKLFCAKWNLNSHLYLCLVSEMLSDCVISWLYMRVLTLTWGNLISLNFPQLFWCFSVERPDGLHWRPDGSPLESGRRWSPHVRTGPDGVRTRAVITVWTVSLYRPDARDQSAPFWDSERPDVINPPFGRGSHIGYKNPCSPRSLPTPQNHCFLAVCELSWL
jgi:hypothetical protein